MEGYLDPLVDKNEVAMGDVVPSNDEDARPKGAPPTILKPGETGAGSTSQRVQYPVQTKEQPLPAAPGSSADPNANAGPIGDAAGISRTGPSRGPDPNNPLGAGGPAGSGIPAGPGSRVN